MKTCNIGPIHLFCVQYEFVYQRYRQKKTAYIIGETPEQVESWLNALVPGIDFMKAQKLNTPISGITNEISQKIATVEYHIIHRKNQLVGKEAKDFEKYTTEYQVLPDLIGIVSKDVEE